MSAPGSSQWCSSSMRAASPSSPEVNGGSRNTRSKVRASLPANRSSARAPGVRVPSQLKSVSRTRSGVGRMAADAGKRNFLPRHVPPMMRRTRARPARLTETAARLPDLPADMAAPCHCSCRKRTLARLVHAQTAPRMRTAAAPVSRCALRAGQEFREMKKLIAAGIVSVAWLAGGCSGGGYGAVGSPSLTMLNGNPAGSTPVTPPSSNTALFHPAAGVLPYPTDLYFAGSTDGTLNIQPANALMPNRAAVNALDGFSTTAVIRERFGGALNPASFTAASVIIVPVSTDNLTKATTGVLGPPLTLGTDFSAGLGQEAGVGATILEIKPLHPLLPSTCLANGMFLGANCTTGSGYLVFLMNGITDASGNPAVPDTDYASIKAALPSCAAITDPSLHGICLLTGAHLQIAAALHLNPANIVLSFSFTTESTVDTLELISATATAQTISVHPTGLTTAAIPGLGLPGHADLYVGVLNVPYYSSKAAPLTEYWHAPPFPLDT